VHTGAINVHRVTEDGREQVIRVFYPGESLGEVVIVGDQSYPASAKATENSQVIVVPTAFFRRQIQQDPDLALRILASMSLHLRYLVETVESLKLNQAESRVVHWLLSQLEDNQKLDSKNPDYTLPLAKHLLASQLGITSETLSRVFARLRERKLAVVEGRHLREIDVAGLRSFLFEVEGDI
jgi:CRP/FNR family transcriptional regulator